MIKTQKFPSFIKGNFSFLIITSIIIVGLFIFLSPKLSSQIFPFKRYAILREFIEKTKKEGHVDPQEYWKFREFYSPGHFIFSRGGISKNVALKASKEMGINLDEKNIQLTFMTFSSKHLMSLDMLTAKTELNEVAYLSELYKNNILFQNKNSLIYQETPSIIKVIFLLSADDMEKANGFFMYDDGDKDLLRNKNWLNITLIKE